jgi:hypothetical protein
LQKSYAQKSSTAFDPYEDYVDRGTLHGGQYDIEDLNSIRATNQSNWEQAGHAVARVATNIVPQIISGYASMVDLPGYVDAEHAANNKIVNWAMDLKKEVDEDWFPIYEEKPGQSMSLSDPAWWMSRGSGLVESVGSFLAQGWGVGKVISGASKAIGSVVQGKKLYAALEAIPGVVSGADTAKRIGGATQSLVSAAMLNQSEAVIEATQVFKDTYAARLADGYNYDKAKKAAAEAASTTMNLNRINILLNLSSATAFLKGSKYTRQLLESPSMGHALKEVVKEGSQEAVEELINHVASKAGMAKGAKKDYNFQNALNDIQSMEGLEAAFLGAIGGVAQTGGTKALQYSKYGPGSTTDEAGNKISYVQDARNRYKQQQEVIDELKEKGVNFTDALHSVKEHLVFQAKLENAAQKGDQKEVDNLVSQMFEVTAFKHFSAGTTQVLEDMLKAEAQKNPDEVGEEYIERAKQSVKELRSLENIFNNSEGYANMEEVYKNQASKLRAERTLPEATRLHKESQFELTKAVDSIAKEYQFEREREVLIKKNGVVVDTETKTEKVPITYSSSDLNINTGDTEANKAVYEKFLEEVKALPSYKATEFYDTQVTSIEKAIRNIDKEFATITSPEYQKKATSQKEEVAKVKQLEKDLPKATSISDIEKMKASTSDKDFHAAADAKIAEIKKGNAAANTKKEKDAYVQELTSRINNATDEELQTLSEEINNAEVSQSHKTNLRNTFDRRAAILNGMPVSQPVDDSDPLSAFGFTNSNPNDTKEEIDKEKASAETGVPQDLPNPKTESQDVEKQVAETATKLLQSDTTRITGEDEQGNLIFNFGRTQQAHDSAAVLNREFDQTNEAGIVTREESTDEIENLQILDPETLQPGTELVMEVDNDYEGEKYDPESTTRETKAWAPRLLELQAKATLQNMLVTQLPEYIAEVPIKVTTKDGTQVFYVHDNAWFREENIDNTPEAIAQDKANNYKIRESIVKKGKVNTTVTYKSNGHLFRSVGNVQASTSEAMPDPNLRISVCKNNSLDFTDGELLPTTLVEGREYAIVPVGPNTFLPVPLSKKPIAQEVTDSIMLVVEAHLNNDSKSPIAQAIAEEMGIDITTTAGLSEYLQHFIYLYPTEKQEGLESVLVSNALTSDRPLIAVTATGIEFGKPRTNMGSYTNADGVKVQSFAVVLSQNFKNNAQRKTNLGKLRAILESGLILSHTRLKSLQSDGKSTLVLNQEGETSTVKYKEQVKNQTQTNLRSINIGTEEAPKYVYTIQPTIKFDVTFAKLSKAKKATTKTTKAKKVTVPKVTPVVKPVVSQPAVSTVEAQKEEIEKRKQDSIASISEDFNGGKIWSYKGYFKDQMGKVATIQVPQEGRTKEQLILEIEQEYDAEIATLEQTTEQVIANSPIPSIEQEVENNVNPEDVLLENAEGVLDVYGIETVKGLLENITLGNVDEEAIVLSFGSIEGATQILQKAVDLHTERDKPKVTFKFPGKKDITITGNTKDSEDISEDTFDDAITPLTEEQVKAQNVEIEAMIIRGINSETQRSLIAYLASDIIQKTLEEKEVSGSKTVNTKDIFNTNKAYFKALAQYYKENGFPNKAKSLEAVVEQYDKVQKLTQQYMALLSTGTVTSQPKTDSEESVGLEKTIYTDEWTFTIDSKATASGDLKKFFAFVQAQDVDGLKENSLGLEEIMPFDVVYDTLHEILANKPADYTTMLETLKIHAERFPWINSVVESLEKAPERIQNEFVSDMAKHHIEMSFIMWEKDKSGNYNLQRWSSNSASKENRLRAMWASNLKGLGTSSNLVVVNDDDEYVFDHTVIDTLLKQSEAWTADPSKVTNDELANWLGQLGIVIADDTYDDLRKGFYNNSGKKSFEQLFTHSQGLIKVLSSQLLKIKTYDTPVEDAKLLGDRAVQSLARLDATNSLNTSSNSFQSGGKTVYSYGNNNYLVNRMRDLTAHNGEKFVNEQLIKHLQETSFTKDSLWLQDLVNDDQIGKLTRRQLGVEYLSLEALKKMFTRTQDNRKLNKLTPAEHEVIKLGLFFNNSGEIINKERRRLVSFFYPTMSDKSTMITVRALSREFKMEQGKISSETLELLYNALVTPEINRIRDKQTTTVKGYEPNYFYFIPALNTKTATINGVEKTFLDWVKDKDDSIYTQEFKDAIRSEVQSLFEQIVEDKLKDWNKLGIGKTIKNDNGKVTDKHTFLDKEYMAKVARIGKDVDAVKFAAMDYVFNSLVANSESFKLFAGDPALYAKYNANKTIQENLEETFINIGKRLAGDIAPGIELANSTNNKYLQVFLKDKELNSNNVNDSVQAEYFTKIMKDYKKNYSGIEGSDAQEYTTWQEHIYVMKQLGRLTTKQFNDITEKLERQTRKAAKGKRFSEKDLLTYAELKIVMQPIKPVYVGNVANVGENVDRRVYIKSSSFPLIPELTAGLQIEKVRKALEKVEQDLGTKISTDGNPAFVRASFGTANKVGAVKNAVEIFDNDGNVKDNLEIKEENTLTLNRSNFRIQQDVPYKREKGEINVGSQEMKLLFVNLLDVQVDGDNTGAELLKTYNQAYKELYEHANEKLAERLGLISSTTVSPQLESLLEIPTTTVVSDVQALRESIKDKSPIQKITAKQKFSEENGEYTIDRVNFINKNFDKIVAALASNEQIKALFQDENNQNKKCE